MNTEKIGKLLKKDNKKVGLIIVIVSLVMLLSSALGTLWNPLFLIEYVLLIPFVGEWGAILVYIGVIAWAGYYYLGIKLEFATKIRVTAFYLFILSTLMFLISCVWTHVEGPKGFHAVGGYISIVDYYDELFVTPWFTRLKEFNGTLEGIQILNVGFILPIVLWITSFFGMFEPLGIILFLIAAMYYLYVVLMNDWVVYLTKLNPFENDKDKIHTNKKAESIDLNEATEEFELNFSPEEKEKIEIIEKVRTNMDRSSYEELSVKIREEREKLKSLREQVLEKVRKQNEELRSQSKISEERREELTSSLSYTSYTLLKRQSENNKVVSEQMQAEISGTENYVQEESIKENKELINEGYKTTEQVLNSEEPMLADAYIDELANSFDPTMELPLINQYYNDIFNDEEALEEEIRKTLETELEVNSDDEVTIEDLMEVSGEVIINNIINEVTVEEYLELPEEIEKSVEKVIDLQQVHAIAEQKDDSTTEETYSSYADADETTSTAEISLEETVWESEEIDEDDEDEVKERPIDWCIPYVLPSTSILSGPSGSFNNSILVEEATDKAKRLNEVFTAFGVKATVNSFEIGPTVSTFKVEIQAGIKTTKVTNLEDNIKLTLGAEYIRIIAPIPGTSFIGIEVPNSTKRPVPFKSVYDETPESKDGIIISIGQDVSGKAMSFDLAKAPHLLVAGSTGSGKSVAINTILASILLKYKPTDVQLVLVDPKMVEFAPFHGIPHLLAEVIIDASNANKALQAMVQEMEDRYLEMAKKGAKKIEELNEILIAEGKAKKPYIVIIIDELADLMMVAAKEVEESIMRITQKARAAGIHMVLATQRPSTEIITGTIKSNIPSRMAFTVASSIDSRTILGAVGAEKLVGMGDMLVSLYGKLPVRGQGAYISNSEVEDITAFTKSQCAAHYVVDVEKFNAAQEFGGALIDTSDPIYIAAKDTVIHYQKASTSMLQRHLNIGYNKAANIIETLEAEGIIGAAKGSKPREVLINE